MRPDRLGAIVMEKADDLAQQYRADALGKLGEAADVGEQD
jgi:hypothetical protein